MIYPDRIWYHIYMGAYNDQLELIFKTNIKQNLCFC